VSTTHGRVDDQGFQNQRPRDDRFQNERPRDQGHDGPVRRVPPPPRQFPGPGGQGRHQRINWSNSDFVTEPISVVRDFAVTEVIPVVDFVPQAVADQTAAVAGIAHDGDGDGDNGLTKQEKGAVVWGTVFRIIGTPVVALLGLLNTAIIVKQTGSGVFGVVSLISTMSLLFPFADLGVGSVVTNAASAAGRLRDNKVAIATIQRAVRVLTQVSLGLIVLFLLAFVFDGWGTIIGVTTGPEDRYVVTAAACIFALTVPTGLGVRILIGVDKNQLAVLIMMSNSAFGLLSTFALLLFGAEGIWYALPGVIGSLLGNIVGTVVALRVTGIADLVFRKPEVGHTKLLSGSVWMLVASIGLPLGLQSHRIILSHLSSPEELSRYALMAQIYALGWSVFSTAGMAFWPVFVKRRDDPAGTIKLWRQIILAFSGVAVVAAIGVTALGPWAASILSSGEVETSRMLAFAFAILLVVQCVHLPSGVLLTAPDEMRWQAYCIVVMGVSSVGLGIYAAPEYGAVGVVLAAAAAVLVAQIVPDFVRVPAMIKRRVPESVDAPPSRPAEPAPKRVSAPAPRTVQSARIPQPRPPR
jgi:O-antigen/teichoic acid export membrane protein